MLAAILVAIIASNDAATARQSADQQRVQYAQQQQEQLAKEQLCRDQYNSCIDRCNKQLIPKLCGGDCEDQYTRCIALAK